MARLLHTAQSQFKLPRTDRPTAKMEATNHREHRGQERAVLSIPETGDHMLLPYARECDRPTDERAQCGRNSEQWYGRTRATAAPAGTVSTLFLDSEVSFPPADCSLHSRVCCAPNPATSAAHACRPHSLPLASALWLQLLRVHAQRRAEYGTLKQQLLDERSKRKEMQRSISELVLATRGELASSQRAPVLEPAMPQSQSSFEIRPQRTVLMQAMSQKGRLRTRHASPVRISPLPIRMGGTGLGLYSPEKSPVTIWELHPAAQARAEVKQIQRARVRRSYGLLVDGTFFDPPIDL
jgi:hypothetical protein